MIKMAVYGKGGIGKSTTVSNLSVAFARRGMKVMQIGCDPKADSTICLHSGKKIPTVLDLLREKNKQVTLDEMVTEGYAGVLCVEAGGPTPGMGCAGRGIIAALEALTEKKAFEVYSPDIVIYDVLGGLRGKGVCNHVGGKHGDPCGGEYCSGGGEFCGSRLCRVGRNYLKPAERGA